MRVLVGLRWTKSAVRSGALFAVVLVCGLNVLLIPSEARAALSVEQQNALAAAAGDPEVLATTAAALALADPANAAEIAQVAAQVNPAAALRVSVAVVRAVPNAAVAVAEIVAPVAGVQNAAALSAALSALVPANSPAIASTIAAIYPQQAPAIISTTIDLNGVSVDQDDVILAVALTTGFDAAGLRLLVAEENRDWVEVSVDNARKALEEGTISFLVAERIDQNSTEGIGAADVTVPDGGSDQQDQASGS